MTEKQSRDEAIFRAAAADWWNPKGAFAPLHALGPLRLQFIRDEITRRLGRDERSLKPFAGLAIADVGCGGGLLSEPMARLGANVTGVDPLVESVEAARAHAQQQGVTVSYQVGDAVSLAGRQFDAVVAMEVIEHTPNPQLFVRDCAGILKPGGLLILSTINRTARSYALAIVAAERILRWLPAGTHEWEKFVTPAELEEACAHAGLSGFQARGCLFNPITGGWRLSHDTGVNYFAAAAKPS
jgi:2-polyprenyl-6-hydroxyphenyl methylase/3-demethylubiquinone-9 3-methyltransferase